MAELEDFMTVQQAAESLGVTRDAIRLAIRRGLLTPTRLGARLNLIPRDQVQSYREHHLRRHGKRPRTENPPQQQEYQRAYYQRRKAAREQQPATEPAEE